MAGINNNACTVIALCTSMMGMSITKLPTLQQVYPGAGEGAGTLAQHDGDGRRLLSQVLHVPQLPRLPQICKSIPMLCLKVYQILDIKKQIMYLQNFH